MIKHSKYDGYQRGLALMVYNFFDKKILLRVQINMLVVVLKMTISEIKN